MCRHNNLLYGMRDTAGLYHKNIIAQARCILIAALEMFMNFSRSSRRKIIRLP